MSQDDDLEILELAARLQLQDIEEWGASQKGKGRVGGRREWLRCCPRLIH